MHIKNVALAGLMTLLLITLTASAANALRSLESSESVIRLLTITQSFTFGSELEINVICHVGITVTLNARSFAKGEKVIGRAALRVLDRETRCEGGRAFVVGGPFELKYLSFVGTLPTIEGLNLQLLRLSVLIEIGALSSCDYTMNVLGFQAVTSGHLIDFKGERAGETFRVESVSSVRLAGIACAARPILAGLLPADRAYVIRLT